MPDIVEPRSQGKEPLDHFLWPMKHITTTSVDDDQTASYPPQLSLHLHGSFAMDLLSHRDELFSLNHESMKGKNSF